MTWLPLVGCHWLVAIGWFAIGWLAIGWFAIGWLAIFGVPLVGDYAAK